MRVWLLLISQLLAWPLLAENDQKQAVDALFADWNKQGVPGAGLGVFKDGKVVYARGYGMANLEHDVANSADSVFRIGSTSKQFTTASIMLLVEQGKLNLDDTLHSFFPDFPDYAKEITIRHLIHHTSGIRDYLTLSYLKGLGDDDYYEDKDIMVWLTSQSELNFKPGTEHLYSNSGYWLLGQIVKEVAGKDMAQFAMEAMFEPLGMHHTHFHNNHKQIVKNRASGYVPSQGGGYEISMTTLNMIGDGGVFTSINDMKIWDDAYYQSAVLSPAFWKAMTTKGQLDDGSEIDYAGGLIIGEHKGLKTISHGGAFVGFRADMVRFPEQHFTVVILANRGDARPSRLAHQVAEIYLSDLMSEKKPTEAVSEAEAALKPEQGENSVAAIEQMTGHYEIQAGVQLKITVEQDRLHATQLWNGIDYDLLPVDGEVNAFTLEADPTIRFTFTAFKNQQSTVLNLVQAGQPSAWQWVSGVEVTGDVALGDFVGDFHSAELDVVYQLRLNGGELTVTVGNNEPLVLNAMGPDQLTYQGSVWDFDRTDGKIAGFTMAAGRVKNLKFTKQ